MAAIIDPETERERREVERFRSYDPDTELIGAVIGKLAGADEVEAVPVMAHMFAMLDDVDGDEDRVALALYLMRDAP